LKERKIQPKVPVVPFVTQRSNLKHMPSYIELCLFGGFVSPIRHSPHLMTKIARQTRE